MTTGSADKERLRREAADWLARLRGPADDKERAAFQRWYEADPAHGEAYDRVKSTYESAGLLARSELARGRGLPERPARRAGSRSYALAAGLALLLISGAVLLGRPEALMAPAEAEPLYFETRIGEIRKVALPDGSRMTLDTKTAVTVEMAPGVRRVTMEDGRARFEVARQDARPFVVQAGRTRVTSRDSTFDVAVRGGAATVQPITGRVSVESSMPDPAKSAAAQLEPGQVITFGAGGGAIQPRSSRRSATMWPTGVLEFDKTPLASVLEEANRYSEARISLADPALARLRVSGTFRAADLEGLARSLEAAFGLRLERNGAGHFILHPGAAAEGVGP